MNKDKIIEIIDTCLEEPHSLSQTWVEVLQTCKQAIIENENLKSEVVRKSKLLGEAVDNFAKMKEAMKRKREYEIRSAETEAIKEFAERLKDMSEDYTDFGHPYVLCKDVDYLVKEMVGEE